MPIDFSDLRRDGKPLAFIADPAESPDFVAEIEALGGTWTSDENVYIQWEREAIAALPQHEREEIYRKWPDA